MSISTYLQKSASMQPRTDSPKYLCVAQIDLHVLLVALRVVRVVVRLRVNRTKILAYIEMIGHDERVSHPR